LRDDALFRATGRQESITMVRGRFETSDGVGLDYVEHGSGSPLLLVHGWAQTAEQFAHQFDALSEHYRVIAYDHRGHGASDRPDHGYRIHRLAADLRELLIGLELQDVAILGHSMGCSVIWAYLELFGPERLSRLILVDEPPCLTVNEQWDDQTRAATGALFSPNDAMGLCNALAQDEDGTVSDGLMNSMLTPECPDDLRTWMMACNRKMDRGHAAELMRNHANLDWRDVISRIRLPALVIGAHASLAPATCMPWVASQIPGARLEMFGADEGGSHFMFAENSSKFNQLVLDFLQDGER
jgi:non-heme chloroperoxidase